VRTVGRFTLLVFSLLLSALLVFAFVGLEAREFPTIWLPFALAAVASCLLFVLPLENWIQRLAAAGISCGVLLMWLLSEPMVNLHARMDLRVAAILFALGGLWCEGSLVKGALTSDQLGRTTVRWAAGLVLMSWLIAFFSSPSGSAGGMLSIAQKMLHLTPEQAETVIFFVRKSIHLCFYGTLGWTGFRLALASGARVRWSFLFGLAVTLAFACFDEGRQSFFPDRTASVFDVMLDTSGALFFISMSGFVGRTLRR
jgi:VanZ family protein